MTIAKDSANDEIIHGNDLRKGCGIHDFKNSKDHSSNDKRKLSSSASDFLVET
ncbi:Uncharacterised protein [Yersinia enterocolitica]|nr:Uncharacterised protein [Yersinia enterocolitica]